MGDPWADWLLLRRFAGSEEVRREFMEHLTQVREKVLDNAEIASGEVLLDAGCGDGLIGFAGLERGARTVAFCDISEQAAHNGDLVHAVEAGVVTRGHVAQLGDVLLGTADGRQSDRDITIFDSTGLAIQDLAIALAAIERVDDMALPDIDLT